MPGLVTLNGATSVRARHFLSPPGTDVRSSSNDAPLGWAPVSIHVGETAFVQLTEPNGTPQGQFSTSSFTRLRPSASTETAATRNRSDEYESPHFCTGRPSPVSWRTSWGRAAVSDPPAYT